MNRDDLIDAIGKIDDDMVETVYALRTAKKEKHHWMKWGTLAACICLVLISLPAFLQHSDSPDKGHIDESISPHIVLDNRTFLASPHLNDSELLPNGFEKAGSITTSDGFENCPYYLNPSIPEWVYVYQKTGTNEEDDETFVRYVDERLYCRDLIFYNGLYYISMWSAEPSKDVTEDDYQQMSEQYGVRIEGSLPEKFVFAGEAEFTGKDTIPKGMLASNHEAGDIYYHPEHPEVLLMKTHWFTFGGDDGEIRHNGYDVYIQYDCPFAQPDE